MPPTFDFIRQQHDEPRRLYSVNTTEALASRAKTCMDACSSAAPNMTSVVSSAPLDSISETALLIASTTLSKPFSASPTSGISINKNKMMERRKRTTAEAASLRNQQQPQFIQTCW
ncbi:hypothetical protein, unlikely [Trypanosoma brucei gambiense DAL972]|uniref:Uncharacterized protein n=1 Tax=Trypanosoma brucei gambiense (strain MHOM/CI/86/DAL972) TaxID=679716 RepID=C9ZTT0_TRYB9|nr:hypothetical protein, unlikely [Trypanosoma brucei gambiense DAL972]CBH12816.1 hypothetical protein, unlikely [Trypanosoma brucei gambiense DAL972]|eukprot:XP_011775095.1 hypothetical protein, unlikely [Trypanosoma brucei gambiense DAL972]